MTTEQIAHRLVELCRQGDYQTCYDELYSPNIISHETMGGDSTTIGMDAIHKKGKEWQESIQELHSTFTHDPIVGKNTFACVMGFDATMRADGQRIQVDEMAVYRVADGKIVEEWFIM